MSHNRFSDNLADRGSFAPAHPRAYNLLAAAHTARIVILR